MRKYFSVLLAASMTLGASSAYAGNDQDDLKKYFMAKFSRQTQTCCTDTTEAESYRKL